MKAIINPERLVSVPFNKTQCGVDFYINTGESKDICGVLTEHKAFKTDFFSFYFFRRANGYLLLNFLKSGVTGWYGAAFVAAPATGMARERGRTRLHFSYFPRRLYAHVHC